MFKIFDKRTKKIVRESNTLLTATRQKEAMSHTYPGRYEVFKSSSFDIDISTNDDKKINTISKISKKEMKNA
jgi:hypothetical protein